MGRIARSRAVLAAAVLLFGGTVSVAWVGAGVLAAYGAKVICSCVFVSGREPALCLEQDLLGYEATLVTARIDREGRAVSARAALLRGARARYREGLGCVLE